MIYFKSTDKNKMYNYILHYLLDEAWNNLKSMDALIDNIIPAFFRREHYTLCNEAMQDLYEWTDDEYIHELKAIHEYILYYAILLFSEYNDNFMRNLYFNEEFDKIVEETLAKDCDDVKPDYIKESYYRIDNYIDDLFIDLDFILIEHSYNSYKRELDIFLQDCGVNLDYYYDLLPIDIQKKYKTGHILLYGDIFEMISYIIDRIENGDLLKLLWNKNKPISEQKIQLVLDSIICAYFETQEIELFWQSINTNGAIQFEFWKRRYKDKKVLMSLRIANDKYLVEGYERILMNQSKNYDNAYYLFFCFTDDQYEKTLRFQWQYVDDAGLYLNFYTVDARKKPSASRIR